MTTRAQWLIFATLTDEQVGALSSCTVENLPFMRAWVTDPNTVICNGETYPFDDPSFSEAVGVWTNVGTIVVNGVTVPAPVPLDYAGQYVYRASPNFVDYFVTLETASERGRSCIARGTGHYTAASAIAHAEAMLLTGG